MSSICPPMTEKSPKAWNIRNLLLDNSASNIDIKHAKSTFSLMDLVVGCVVVVKVKCAPCCEWFWGNIL